jgi:glyoxylase-like metal-dependent hydrolase (beta-lactamase superfamily II)
MEPMNELQSSGGVSAGNRDASAENGAAGFVSGGNPSDPVAPVSSVPPIPLEDGFSDILSKAMRGLRLGDDAVAERTGIAALEVRRLREGQFNEVAVRKIASVLGLGVEALVRAARRQYFPAPVRVQGVAQFNTPFEDMTVNSYVVWDPVSREAAVFDTGSDCAPALEFVRGAGLRVTAIALTHAHGDHIFDLDRLREKTGVPAYASALEPVEGAQLLGDGAVFQIGRLSVEARLTTGHSVGGLTYVVSGLEVPVAVVGDSLFAGSMGGGGVSYPDALRNNREKVLTLPAETVICPGHGPMTTVGEELEANPFFAK